MKKIFLATLLLATSLVSQAADTKDGFVSLFDGKTLHGWKANEHTNAFKVEEGKIVVNGERGHLFYVGPVNHHAFTNFEFKAEVMTKTNSNSGIYFHTAFQDNGWPDKGFESQVCNSYHDNKKTGSLYNVKDINKSPVNDNEWFRYHIIVQGKHVIIKINDQVTTDYVEPDNYVNKGQPGRKIGQGTFALQAHDPGSTAYYRNIQVKPLP